MIDSRTTQEFKDWLLLQDADLFEIFADNINVEKDNDGNIELKEPSAEFEFQPDQLQLLSSYFTTFRKSTKFTAI